MISLKSIIFNGMDATPIDVQVQLSAGLSKPEFNIIGLADRAVRESAERIRNVLSAMNLALPSKRLTVNLSPADVEKSGSHFDLPILCGILCALGIFPPAVYRSGRRRTRIVLRKRFIKIQKAPFRVLFYFSSV